MPESVLLLTRALAVSPPADWPSSQRRDHVAWAHEVAAGLRGANAWLGGRVRPGIRPGHGRGPIERG